METQKTNIFILSDNALVVNGLRHELEDRFRGMVNVTGFFDSRSCLKKVDASTHVVVLDHFLEGKSSLPASKCISALNPNARIIMHSSREEVISSVDARITNAVTYTPALNFSNKQVNQYR